MSHLKVINASQDCIHKYEKLKGTELCFTALYLHYIIPYKHNGDASPESYKRLQQHSIL
jgi:hypothetical protein